MSLLISHRHLLSLLALSCLVLSGCGVFGDTSNPLDLEDYDRSCQADADCALAYWPEDLCASPCDPNLAVNVADAQRLEADVDRAIADASCNEFTSCGAPDPDSPRPEAYCGQGTCLVRRVCMTQRCEERQQE